MVVGTKQIVLKSMIKIRKYFNNKLLPQDYWWILAILSIFDIIIFQVISDFIIFSIIILSVLIILLFITLFLIILKLLDVQKLYPLPKMSQRALKISRRVKSKFSDSVLAEHLKMGITKTTGIMLPSISVWISDELDVGALFIENLGAFDKLNKSQIIQSISGILPSPYEAVFSSLVLGGSFVRFDFEDTETSHRFIIKNNDLTPFINNDDIHSLKLSDDLIWNARKVPHASIIGRSGSGKTMFVGGYLAHLAHLQGWKVIYASAKPDRYTRLYNGPINPEQITEKAEELVGIMQSRLKEIHKKGFDDYSYMDDMPDIAFFIDELGHFNAMLDSDKKLKERFISAMKSLSFTSRSANSGEERKFLMPGFNELPNRNYQQSQGIAMVLESGRKWATPHYFETPLF